MLKDRHLKFHSRSIWNFGHVGMDSQSEPWTREAAINEHSASLFQDLTKPVSEMAQPLASPPKEVDILTTRPVWARPDVDWFASEGDFVAQTFEPKLCQCGGCASGASVAAANASVVSDYTALLSKSSWWNYNAELQGAFADYGRGAFVSFSFETAPPAYLSSVYSADALGSFQAFNAAAKVAAITALFQYSSVSGIEFFEVPTGMGDIAFGAFDLIKLGEKANTAGIASYPEGWTGGGFRRAGDVYLDLKYNAGDSTAQLVLQHEIGHALGLKHPFEGNITLSAALDNNSQTVMSYNRSLSYARQLGPLDIQAVQHLYGTRDQRGNQISSYKWDNSTRTLTQVGGSAPDRIRGIGGNNDITAGDGNDFVEGNIGKDYVDGGRGNDSIASYEGEDTLVGGEGSDSLAGGEGTDLLNGGEGKDQLFGGDGFDYASYRDAISGLTLFMGGGTFNTGEANGDTHNSIEGLIGSQFSDIIGADSGANELAGLNGNDFIFGRAGVDTLRGGGGNDVLDGGTGGDILYGGEGLDVAYFRDATTAVTASLLSGGTFGEAAGDIYFETENIWGSNFNDVLTGDNSSGQVYGFAGDDQLSGLDGEDYFYGGQGFDTLTGGGGVDNFFFLSWNDHTNQFGTLEPYEGGDTFTDFTSGTDKVILSRYWFGFGNIGGPAAALTETHANFVTNGAVSTGRPSLIWNNSARTLSFDADGNGATQAVLLGTFQGSGQLTLGDIWTA